MFTMTDGRRIHARIEVPIQFIYIPIILSQYDMKNGKRKGRRKTEEVGGGKAEVRS